MDRDAGLTDDWHCECGYSHPVASIVADHRVTCGRPVEEAAA